MCPVSQPRGDLLPQGPQEVVSLARVCLPELPISGGASTSDGCPGGVASATDHGHRPEPQRSAEQDSQAGDAAQPETHLSKAPEEPATVHVGQGCSKW